MARTIRVETAPAYDVHIGPGVLAELDARTTSFSARAALTDANVERLYAARLAFLAPDLTGSADANGSPGSTGSTGSPDSVGSNASPGSTATSTARVLSLPAGEASKNFRELERVLDFLVANGLDRQSCLIAFGGGVTGDLGGFAASLFMRGIAYAQVPTTLLAQVDSSVGGKTAVNLAGGKNLAGTFHQPCVVLADTSTLATLSDDEYRSGLGEVIKTALLDGEDAFAALERDVPAILARDADVLAEIVARCVQLKARIVGRDPHERGERKALNFGHTFAHAIEREAEYGSIPHGVAVGVGVVCALRMSAELGVLSDRGWVERVERLMTRLVLPTTLAALEARTKRPLAPSALVAAMRHDKKGRAGAPRFVLLERPGAWKLDVAAEARRIEAALTSSHSG